MSKKRLVLKKIRVSLLVIVVIALIMALCLIYVSKLLEENSDETAGYIISDYVSSEESNINIYKTILSLSTRFILEMESKGADVDEIKRGLYPYLNGMSSMVRKGDIEIYGIVDGRIISNNPELEDYEGYDYKSAVWYKKGLAANGNIIFTDVYNDTRTGKKNITIAKRVDNSDSILAIDVYLDEFASKVEFGDLPTGVSYYLCDSKGQIIHFKSKEYEENEECQQFIDNLYKEISNGHIPEQIKDEDGFNNNIYYEELENGWGAVLTTSYRSILKGISNVYVVVFGILSLGVLSVTAMAYREYKSEKKRQNLEKEKREVEYDAHIFEKAIYSMAMSYREIYYLDLVTGKYRMVYPEINNINEMGDYEAAVRHHIDIGKIKDESRDEIIDFLKIENIKRELMDKDSTEFKYRKRSLNNPDTYEWCLNTITIADRDSYNRPLSATASIRSIEKMIKEERDRQELLKIAAKRAEIANKAKSDFLSRMSHDIRTPMNVILGMTAVATMNIDNKEKVKDSLKKISMSGKHLLALINDVLDMSKIESGQEQLFEGKFEIVESLQSIVSMFQNQLQDKKISSNLIIKNLKNNNVIGDERKLQQIFVNILGNAVKFTDDGGKIQIYIEQKKSIVSGKGYYEFTFEDNGIGIEKEFINRIFEPFARADETGSTEGTGLGMAIAINIAKMMGGDIAVESNLGCGSKFIVDVYLKIDEDGTEESHNKENEFDDYLQSDFSGKRILLVEDNESNAEIALELLTAVGIKVEVAENGEKAIERLIECDNNYFDLIFMDIQMPVMNGYEATRIIRKMQRKDMQDIPIIAMSAYAFAEDFKKAKDAGMNGSITKPIDISKLTDMLHKML